MSNNQTFVIVGASLAGAKASATLRDEGFEGRIVLVGSETERPYERPPLSKEYLRGETEREEIHVHEAGYYEQHQIELRTGVTATAIDTKKHEVSFDDGQQLGYDKLLLTTGASPRRLPIPGAELEGVLYLRSVEDCEALRGRLGKGGKVVVVGSGWIGSEVAASARQQGLDVTVLDPLSVPLERVLGTEVGAIYRDLHTENGVKMLLGTGVEVFEGDGAVEHVKTSDGQTLDCDFVLVGIGAVPNTELAEAAGIAVENGILVDERLQTSVPDVFAAGDVANHQHPFYGERLRVEHWDNAIQQGQHAARAMLGNDDPYTHLPYFFSDQYDAGMEYSGHAQDWDRVVFRGDPKAREFIAFWIKDDRVVAGMNCNIWDVNDELRRLIEDKVTVSDSDLADTEVPLKDLV